MQFKLKDIYKTRYFYVSYRNDLVYLFNTYLDLLTNKTRQYNVGNDMLGQIYEAAKCNAPVQFDLADCKFTPDVTKVLSSYAEKGIEFIDTENMWRNNILKTNRERRQIDVTQFTVLPEYDITTPLPEYIKALSSDIVYTVPVNLSEVYIPILFMIMATKPSVKLCLNNHCNSFFDFVGSQLTLSDLYQYTEFYFTTPEGVEIVDFSSGKIYIQRLCALGTMEEALAVGTLVPTVLGKERLIKDPVFRDIFKKCVRIVENYRKTRKPTLLEFLLEENMYDNNRNNK